MLKAFEKELGSRLPKVYKNIRTERTKMLQEYKYAKVVSLVSLFKKGLKTDPNNYRSLFTLEKGRKPLCKIIKSKVKGRTGHKLDKYKSGFRKEEALSKQFGDSERSYETRLTEAMKSLKTIRVQNLLSSLIWKILENPQR